MFTKQDFLKFCASLDNTVIDQPFKGDYVTTVARHADTRKWFAIVIERDGRSFVNLKINPLDAGFLCHSFKGIEPAYHMNKWHWISVIFGMDVPDDLICDLTMTSYFLTRKGKQNFSVIAREDD